VFTKKKVKVPLLTVSMLILIVVAIATLRTMPRSPAVDLTPTASPVAPHDIISLPDMPSETSLIEEYTQTQEVSVTPIATASLSSSVRLVSPLTSPPKIDIVSGPAFTVTTSTYGLCTTFTSTLSQSFSVFMSQEEMQQQVASGDIIPDTAGAVYAAEGKIRWSFSHVSYSKDGDLVPLPTVRYQSPHCDWSDIVSANHVSLAETDDGIWISFFGFEYAAEAGRPQLQFVPNGQCPVKNWSSPYTGDLFFGGTAVDPYGNILYNVWGRPEIYRTGQTQPLTSLFIDDDIFFAYYFGCVGREETWCFFCSQTSNVCGWISETGEVTQYATAGRLNKLPIVMLDAQQKPVAYVNNSHAWQIFHLDGPEPLLLSNIDWVQED